MSPEQARITMLEAQMEILTRTLASHPSAMADYTTIYNEVANRPEVVSARMVMGGQPTYDYETGWMGARY